MIVWLNGPFEAGKTTLAGRLRLRWPDLLVFDPEEIGFVVRATGLACGVLIAKRRSAWLMRKTGLAKKEGFLLGGRGKYLIFTDAKGRLSWQSTPRFTK